MSITTKRGDDGHTDLMYGRRVPKDHPRVAAYGSIDELTSSLGIVRAHAVSTNPELAGIMATIQDQLVIAMGQLATNPDDRPRYETNGFPSITDKIVVELTERTRRLEVELALKLASWAIPGAAGLSLAAYLDMARTIARRAERHLVALLRSEASADQLVIAYLNRLSDYLWLLARAEEKRAQAPPLRPV